MNEARTLATKTIVDSLRLQSEEYLTFAAHDLRSPINRLISLAELLRMDLEDIDNLDPEVMSCLGMIEDVCSKAQHMVSDLLNYHAASHADLSDEVFCLADMCRDIFTLLDPQRKHDLRAQEQLLRADRVALQVVLRNLVDNAIKYCGDSRARVRVSIEDSDMGPEIIVVDDGPGLSFAQLRVLNGEGVQHGSGFGLLGIKRLVQMRQGHLGAENGAVGGARFRLRLRGLTLLEYERRVARG